MKSCSNIFDPDLAVACSMFNDAYIDIFALTENNVRWRVLREVKAPVHIALLDLQNKIMAEAHAQYTKYSVAA